MVHHNSTPNFIFSRHQNKAENQNLYDSEVLISDFPGFRTSTASKASVASMTHTTSFDQKKMTDTDGWIIPGTTMTNTCPLLWHRY